MGCADKMVVRGGGGEWTCTYGGLTRVISVAWLRVFTCTLEALEFLLCNPARHCTFNHFELKSETTNIKRKSNNAVSALENSLLERKWLWHLNTESFIPPSCPGARSERGQSGRVVEVHRQHHFSVQTRWAPHSPRRPTAVGSCQGRGLQMSQNQAREEVPAPGHRWRFPRPEWCGGRQGKLAHPLEGPVGPPAEEISTAR